MTQLFKNTDTPLQFDFGANWAAYARTITPEKINKAEKCLRQLVGQDRLDGLTFLDIGCGSGLHALAALRLGAQSVHAIDVNINSVTTTRNVLQQYAADGNWIVEQKSILDDLPASQYDIVYSWGVLHHTGAMNKAVHKAASLVRPGGKFIIALYKKTPLCGFWRIEKRLFNALPSWLRFIPTSIYVALYACGLLAQKRNPISYIRSYKNARGMNFWHDAIDWLGGYPYESATPDEVDELVTTQGFQALSSFNTRPCTAFGVFGSGCAEYAFLKRL